MRNNYLALKVLPLLLIDLVLFGASLVNSTEMALVVTNIMLVDLFIVIALYFQSTLSNKKNDLYLNYPVYYFTYIFSLLMFIVAIYLIINSTPLPFIVLIDGILSVAYLILFNLFAILNNKAAKNSC